MNRFTRTPNRSKNARFEHLVSTICESISFHPRKSPSKSSAQYVFLYKLEKWIKSQWLNIELVNYLYYFRYRRKLEFSSEKVKWFLIENSKKLNVFTKNECIELSFAVVEARVFWGSFEGYFWVTHTRVDTSFRASKKMFNITSNDVNYKIF